MTKSPETGSTWYARDSEVKEFLVCLELELSLKGPWRAVRAFLALMNWVLAWKTVSLGSA